MEPMYIIRRWADGWKDPAYLTKLAEDHPVMFTHSPRHDVLIKIKDYDEAKILLFHCFEHHRYDSWNRFEILNMNDSRVVVTLEWDLYPKPEYID
jgi:hypothetical protein